MKSISHGTAATKRAYHHASPRMLEPDRLPAKDTMEHFWIQHGWGIRSRHGIRLRNPQWKGAENTRRDAVRFLVDKVVKKEPRDMVQNDFKRNRLRGLLENYYRGSPYDALKDAGYELHPWELPKSPNSLFKSKGMRVAAVDWLVEKLNKDVRRISAIDFYSNRLGGLLGNYYHLSPYEALHEAGYKLRPWEMEWSPRGIFMEKKDRVKATRWAVRKFGGDVRDIVAQDFFDLGLDGLLAHHGNSPLRALTEAGYRILPWEMRKSPSGYFKKKANRVLAVNWLVDETGKAPTDLTKDDFKDNSLGGLLATHYRNSPYLAVLEAKLVTRDDKAYMCHGGPRLRQAA
ncbi:MAG: hypothetical protein PHV13_04980 [Candidatus ainarchaeum sp.]|nr:hypothetical protein [Candidatus ainarchaeum sp.]